MHKLMNAALAAALSVGTAGPLNAGVAKAFTFASPTVTAVSDRVTYAMPAISLTPELVTFVGFDVGDIANNVLVTNTSGNTVNRFRLTFTASVNKADGVLSAEQLTLQPLDSTIPSSCTYSTLASNPVTITCSVAQLKFGATFAAFTVFFKAPQSVDSPTICAGSTEPVVTTPCNTVRTRVDLVYSEGTNDLPTGLPNSTQTSGELKLVALGTTNPSFVKSAAPKSGSKLFTGNGVPAAGLPGEFKEFTEAVTLPTLGASYRYAQASIKVSDDSSAQCTNLGNFKTCPLYTTSIIDPSTTGTVQFTTASPLQFVYRIDSSKLKRPLSQILNNVQIFYSQDGILYDVAPLLACITPGQANGDGKPCIDTQPGSAPRCFKNLASAGGIAGLVGDCQWTLLSDSNGFIKFN